jgi:WD40 repeat protein
MMVSLLSVLLLLSTSQVPAGRLDLDSVLRNVSNGAVGTYFSWTFSPNGKWIVGGSSPVTVTDNAGKNVHPSGVFIWDAKTGKFLKRLGDHDARVDFLAFSANSQRLVSAHVGRSQSKDPKPSIIQVWDLRRAKLKQKFQIDGSAKRARITGDGKWMVWLGKNESLSVWNLEKGKMKWQLKDTGLKHIDVSPDGKTVVGTFIEYEKTEIDGKTRRRVKNRGIRAWDLSDGTQRWHVQADDRQFRAAPIFYLPDGNQFFLLVDGSDKKPASLVRFHAADGSPAARLNLAGLDSVGTVGISSDGHRLAVTEFMGDALTMWNLDDGEQLMRIDVEFPMNFLTVAFSPDLDRVGGTVPGIKKDTFHIIGPGVLPLTP